MSAEPTGRPLLPVMDRRCHRKSILLKGYEKKIAHNRNETPLVVRHSAWWSSAIRIMQYGLRPCPEIVCS